MTAPLDTQRAERLKRGRPRHHDADTEREMIIVAGYAAIRDQGDRAVTISDILSAAGVSTRAFYRHFQSKDELLCAMYRRDAERAAARLDRHVDASATPIEALETWVDEILGFTRIQPKAERVTVLGSIVANRAEGSQAEAQYGNRLIVASLERAIESGVASGVFASPDPFADAHMIAAVVFDAAGLSTPGAPANRLPTARDTVLSFCLRALRVA